MSCLRIPFKGERVNVDFWSRDILLEGKEVQKLKLRKTERKAENWTKGYTRGRRIVTFAGVSKGESHLKDCDLLVLYSQDVIRSKMELYRQLMLFCDCLKKDINSDEKIECLI
jgi:hypothetical protein